MNVLSLFDGMSCGQIALERAGIKVDNYYASEIDKYAIKVTMANYPNTVQLGSVINLDGYSLPKIDLMIGGSPCTNLSFAGKRKGMQTKSEIEILTLEHYLQLKDECYEFEGQSYLFWEYIRLLNEVKPKYFLLENVEMGSKWEAVFNKAIGSNGLHINSALVSAQNRKRIYWSNINIKEYDLFGSLRPNIPDPKDKKILLKHILQTDVPDKYFIKNVSKLLRLKRNITDSHREGSKGGTGSLSRNDGNTNAIEIVAMRGRGTKGSIEQQLESNGTQKTNSITTVQKDNLVMQLNPLKESNGCQPYQQNRIYDADGISPALMAQMSSKTHAILEKASRIRRLTEIECERLQTVPDNYTNHVSSTQRYKMLGNGWTVDVIAHILRHIKC